MRLKPFILTLCTAALATPLFAQQGFPYIMPETQPNQEMSVAMERVYNQYGANTPQNNELFTLFKYSPIQGLDYNGFNGTITRRDPSRIVKVGDTYYMWYTLRNTESGPVGGTNCTDTKPSVDWDLCDIGYATSKDGFTWEEQGVAVKRPEKPTLGWRSVSTPEILVWEGKYYLYFQAFSKASGTGDTAGGDDCPVAMAEADSPNGPWRYIDEIIIPNGKEGEWDMLSIHDPLPVVFKGKIYMYYKSDYNGKDAFIRSQGVAIGDNPKGPFVKSPLNPIMSSGHETQLFRFKEGIAAILTRDGHEHNTIQYSDNGIDFNVASIVEFMPNASGLYDPDAFTNTPYADGITWGVCHHTIYQKQGQYTMMLRFDCDLSLKVNEPYMKQNHVPYTLEEYMRRGLTAGMKQKIIKRESEN